MYYLYMGINAYSIYCLIPRGNFPCTKHLTKPKYWKWVFCWESINPLGNNFLCLEHKRMALRGFIYAVCIARRGGWNQEKSQKWCLGLRPIYLERTIPGVFKTSFWENPENSSQWDNSQKHFLRSQFIK